MKDELTERTTIPFQRPLDVEEFRGLMKYLSQYLPARVNIGISESQWYFPEGSDEHSVLGISGRISRWDKAKLVDFAYRTSRAEDFQRVNCFLFNRRIGFDELSEYSPEEIKLWEDTRRCIAKYFESQGLVENVEEGGRE